MKFTTDSLRDAKKLYAKEDYVRAYERLAGVELNNDEDKKFYQEAMTLSFVHRQYESFTNYRKMNMDTEALNALVKGIDRYYTYREDAVVLGVEEKMNGIYNVITEELSNTYKISEAEAISMSKLMKEDYVNYWIKIEGYTKK